MNKINSEKIISQKIQDIVDKQVTTKNEHLEMFAAAYLLHTNIPPDEAELVEIRGGDAHTIETRWFFRRRTDTSV